MSKYDQYFKLLRLDKPIPVFLLVLPCWFSLTLSWNNLFSWSYLGYFLFFLVAAFVTRSMGCIINDIWDREIDKHVSRTKDRPLASSKLSIKDVYIPLSVLMIISFAMLFVLKTYVFWLIPLFFIMIIVYPLTKRFFWIPQLFLGFTFGSGALIAFAGIHDYLNLSAILMYIGCVFWIAGYDTIYACRDREDDKRLGLFSSAIFFEGNEKQWIWLSYRCSIFFWAASISLERMSYVCYILFLLVILLLYLQIKKVDFEDFDSCTKWFNFNVIVGFTFYVTIFLGRLL